MYQIKCTNGADLSFVDKYAPKILSVINEYLTKNRTKKLTINNQEIIIGVDKDSLTYKFLTSISTIEKLKKYLLLSPISQFKIVEKLHKCAYEDELIFKKNCKSRYEKYHKNGIIPFDHFNEICYDIFVNNGYDDTKKKPIFDKKEFITNTGINVCPYCGSEFIKPTDRTKHHIDHFLPKRKYPFFAFSYYNLIPSCVICNNVPNKGDNDPLFSYKNIPHGILNPYIFKSNIIRFNLKINGMEIYNDNNFELLLGFITKEYFLGYNEFFDISDRYTNFSNFAARYYKYVTKELKTMPYYVNLQIDPEWLSKVYKNAFMIDKRDDQPEKEVFSRMKWDIFCQLTKQNYVGKFHTKQSPNKPVELF